MCLFPPNEETASRTGTAVACLRITASVQREGPLCRFEGFHGTLAASIARRGTAAAHLHIADSSNIQVYILLHSRPGMVARHNHRHWTCNRENVAGC